MSDERIGNAPDVGWRQVGTGSVASQMCGKSGCRVTFTTKAGCLWEKGRRRWLCPQCTKAKEQLIAERGLA